MYVISRKCIQITRQGRYQRFTFTSFHFGNFAVMQRHTANKLNIEVTKSNGSNACFTNSRKSFRKQIVQVFARIKAFTEFYG